MTAAACGGKSVLYADGDDSSTGGEPNPPPTGGRSGEGGTGATTGAAPSGGTPSTGGAFSGGGVSNGGTVSTGGTGATTGTGGAQNLCADQPNLPPREQGIWWDESGVIHLNGNGFGVQGQWYSADDCSSVSPGLACTMRDPAFTGPDGLAGWTTMFNHACASGVAAQVGYKPDGTFTYSEQWGFLLGFTLNGGNSWNARERCVEGVAFSVTGTAPARLRINLTTVDTFGASHFREITALGAVFLPFTEFAQGSWVTNPVPLDTTALTGIEIHVFTDIASPTPFSFCVSDVRFMYQRLIP